jgi:hypothetical protein
MSRRKPTKPKKRRKSLLQHDERRNRRPRPKSTGRSKKRTRIKEVKRRAHKRLYARRKSLVRARRRQVITDPRIARGLGLMRRYGISASEAAKREGIKLDTFRKGAGRFLHRSGLGKPWKARTEDQLRFSMSVLTPKGRVAVIVRNSRERKLLHDYETAVNMFRGAEDGADEELKKFAGKRVGGHELVTDPNILIELEEADELDFDSLYTPPGGKS